MCGEIVVMEQFRCILYNEKICWKNVTLFQCRSGAFVVERQKEISKKECSATLLFLYIITNVVFIGLVRNNKKTFVQSSLTSVQGVLGLPHLVVERYIRNTNPLASASFSQHILLSHCSGLKRISNIKSGS